MITVDVEEAQVQFLSLLERVEAGEEVVIERGGVAVAKLVPFKPKGKRQPGMLKGKITIDDRFFEPLPEDELRAWEGGQEGDCARFWN